MKILAVSLLVIGAVFAFAPADAFAQERIIPCGYEGGPDCNFCHIFALGKNVINFLIIPSPSNPLPLVMAAGVLLVAVGGFLMLTSGGDPGRYGRGRQILGAIAIGLLIIYGAWLAVNFALEFFGVAEWKGFGKWWEIDCAVSSSASEGTGGDGGDGGEEGPPPSAPTVSLSASPSSITEGDSSTLTWTVSDAASCTASGAWSGSKSPSGDSETVSPSPAGTHSYALECSGDGGTASDSAPITVSIAKKRAFVSSGPVVGNLGALSVVDSFCTARASVAGLGGIWKGWVSTKTVNAKSRIADQAYYTVEPFGILPRLIALNMADLTDGSIANSIENDEFGKKVPGGPLVWTGTKANGEVAAETCNNWLSAHVLATGRVGLSSRTDAWWTDASVISCATGAHIYCFEQ